MNIKDLVKGSVINGKKLTQPEVNLLNKLVETGYIHEVLPSSAATRTNPFSQASRVLEPLAVVIYDFTVAWMLDYERGLNKAPVSVFDRARYLFLKLWPDAYSELID